MNNSSRTKMIGNYFDYHEERKLMFHNAIKIEVEGPRDPMREIIRRIPIKKSFQAIKSISNTLSKRSISTDYKNDEFFQLTKNNYNKRKNKLILKPIEDYNHFKRNVDVNKNISNLKSELESINEKNIELSKLEKLKLFENLMSNNLRKNKLNKLEKPINKSSLSSSIYEEYPNLNNIKQLREGMSIIDKFNKYKKNISPCKDNIVNHEEQSKKILNGLRSLEKERNKLLFEIMNDDTKLFINKLKNESLKLNKKFSILSNGSETEEEDDFSEY